MTDFRLPTTVPCVPLYTFGEGGASLPAFDKSLQFVLERRYLDLVDTADLALDADPAVARYDFRRHLRVLQVKSVAFEGSRLGALHLSNMQNVLSALADGAHSLIMAVTGRAESSSLYYGVSVNPGVPGYISIDDATAVLENGLRGNFSSVSLARLGTPDVGERLLEPILNSKEVIAVPGIPSPRSVSDEAPFVQGMERLIEAMNGEKYLMLVIAEPISRTQTDLMIEKCLDLGSMIHAMVRDTVQVSEGSTHSFNLNLAAVASAIAGIPMLSGLVSSLGYSYSMSKSVSVSHEYLNRTADYCEKLCERYAQRLRQGKSHGLWNTGIYLFADNAGALMRGGGALRAALSGGETHWEPIRSIRLSKEIVAESIAGFRSPQFEIFRYGIETARWEELIRAIAGIEGAGPDKTRKGLTTRISALLEGPDAGRKEVLRYNPSGAEMDSVRARLLNDTPLGHPLGSVMAGVSTPLNTEELAIIVNVPRHEVNGIGVREAATFAVNLPPVSGPGESLHIGSVVHKGRVCAETLFNIPLNDLTKHGFVCGVTGSGKTNTCIHILRQLNGRRIPFLVVEPAKSEYRSLMPDVSDLHVFTLGQETVSPFRLNPFEFSFDGGLLRHIDALKAVFNAAFPMYASMPYLLEEAVYEIYTDRGWDLATSENRYLQDSAWSFYDYLPTLEDLHRKIDSVVRAKQYAQELTMDLSAALRARLGSLLNGSKGLMLNTKRSTPLAELLANNVVLELRHIGDDDEKCFIMGLIFMRLYEYREAEQGSGGQLRHVTLIEEAHRLLRNEPGVESAEVSNLRGKALETFSNVISEIREYGEGIVVVDQIPAKLAPDVVKNTNFKIVHRTLAKDDRDAVGATMGLTEEQNRELALLGVGRGVAHSAGIDKPFLLQIPVSKRAGSPSDAAIAERMQEFHKRHDYVFMRLPGFEKVPGLAKEFGRTDFRRFVPEVADGIIALAALLAIGEVAAATTITKRALMERMRDFAGAALPPAQSCYLIRYADWFFSGLTQTNPHCYDRCLYAHRLFVDIWFDPPLTAAKQLALDFQATLAQCIRSGSILDPMVSWFVAQSDLAKQLGAILVRTGKARKMKCVDGFLSTQASNLVLGTVIAARPLGVLKKALLNQILQGNPYAPMIISSYAAQYLGGSDE